MKPKQRENRGRPWSQVVGGKREFFSGIQISADKYFHRDAALLLLPDQERRHGGFSIPSHGNDELKQLPGYKTIFLRAGEEEKQAKEREARGRQEGGKRESATDRQLTETLSGIATKCSDSEHTTRERECFKDRNVFRGNGLGCYDSSSVLQKAGKLSGRGVNKDHVLMSTIPCEQQKHHGLSLLDGVRVHQSVVNFWELNEINRTVLDYPSKIARDAART
jgi:hypothetical protein